MLSLSRLKIKVGLLDHIFMRLGGSWLSAVMSSHILYPRDGRLRCKELIEGTAVEGLGQCSIHLFYNRVL